MASKLQFYKGSYADFYEKFLKVVDGKTALSADTNALYFTEPITGTIPEDLKNDVLSKSYGIWLGTNLLSSSYVANDRGNLINVELVDGKPEKDAEGNLTGTTAGQYLKYTYQLSNGNEEEVWFPVSDLLIDSEFDTNNFKVDSAGKVSISNVQTSATTLDEEIVVAGLSESIGEIANGTKLEAGTSVLDILKKMFVKEIYPEPGGTTANATISITPPKFNYNKSGILAYGTEITVTGTCGTQSVKVTGNTVTNLKYGSTTTLDKATINTGTTSITKSVTSSVTSGYSITVSTNGFTNDVTAQTIEGQTFSISGLSVGIGVHTTYLTGNTQGVSATCEGITSGYVASNLGNVISGKTYPSRASLNKSLTASATGDTSTDTDNTSKITGVLPCYSNIDGNASTTGKVITTLTDKAQVVINNVPSTMETYFKFYYPADRTVSSVLMPDVGGNEVTYPSDQYIADNGNVTISVNGTNIKYKELAYKGGKGALKFIKINLSKNLSQADFEQLQ